MASGTDGEKTSALRVLRFLDTPASVHELVLRLGTQGDRSEWNEVAGLSGSRYQNLVVRELEQQMSAPDIALTSSYLSILAKLKLQLDHEPLPPYPQKDTKRQKIWNERTNACMLRMRTSKGYRTGFMRRSEERRVGKECRSRWSPY